MIWKAALLKVMVRLKASMGVLMSAHCACLAFTTADKRQVKFGMLSANLNGHPAEGALGAQDKGRGFCGFGFGMPVCFHALISFLIESTSGVPEMASRFGGKSQPSQKAQRVANGR